MRLSDYQRSEYNSRYHSMEDSDLGMTTKNFENFEVINFDNYSIYKVDIIRNHNVTKARCNCPDYNRRGIVNGVPCKHILYVLVNYNYYRTLQKEICSNVINYFNKNMKVR